VQELMRHAKLSTTMEVYTHARMEKKREAQSKVVDVLFGRHAKDVVASLSEHHYRLGFMPTL
jgi:hypothetical protein